MRVEDAKRMGDILEISRTTREEISFARNPVAMGTGEQVLSVCDV